jgi:hypothetical protein
MSEMMTASRRSFDYLALPLPLLLLLEGTGTATSIWIDVIPSMLSRPSLQLDADAMWMRVQSMPLFAADAGSWIDVTLLQRADGRARG